MNCRDTSERVYFLFPEGLENIKKNKNLPEIEHAIKNVEWLQRKQPIDNTMEFVRIESDSLSQAIEEQNIDIVLRLLPTFLTDVKKLLRKHE